MQTVRFSNQSPTIYRDLRAIVNAYFKDMNISPTGNFGLYFKTGMLLSILIGLYVHLVFFTPPWPWSLIECLFLGIIVAMIGFNIMHDGAHGSFSKRSWVNELAGLTVNFLGANVFLWKTKHNTVHHTFTNVDGVDDDLDAGVFLRLSPQQKHLPLHRYQFLYFPLIYSILYFYWVFFSDYKKYFSGKVGVIPISKMTLKNHLVFWGFKIWYLFAFIIIPIHTAGFIPWLVGYLLFGTVTGIVLSIVFQLAHTVEDAQFPEPDQSNRLEDEWALHQLKTTANFATRKRWVTWVTGGLNHQIEHHLFPHISHVHYPKISLIIKNYCLQNNLPYVHYSGVRLAFKSHIRHLKNLGRAA